MLSVDQGTSGTRAIIINCDSGEIIAEHSVPLPNLFPQEGWVEISPRLILATTLECIERTVAAAAESKGVTLDNIVGVGITNQRETTLVWDSRTGEPLYNAIVWLDNRTNETVKKLIDATPSKSAHHFQSVVGLPISPYFSAVKLRWLLDNVPEVSGDHVMFGTVDSWLIWNLTREGGSGPGTHVTDVTNASRTMLMNLKTLQWDEEMCKFFGVNMGILPKIRSSAEVYGHITTGVLAGKPIAGCLGDQQAALFGQHCFERGEAKCTYGTGCFMLSNTGHEIVESSHGLLTTVAYKIGEERAVYALEGAVAIGGEVVRWLRDNLQIISTSSEIEKLCSSVDSTHDLYFVPAFSGLYAPYWDPTARGLIIGITAYTNRAHLARAALEAVCFQVSEILNAMDADSGAPLVCLRSDGGMTKNRDFLGMQADTLGIPVECRAASAEATAMGAGMAAAKALGVWNVDKLPGEVVTFNPRVGEAEREGKMEKWKDAVQRCRGWTN